MESRTSALIVAQAAQIRDSLLVLLRAIPQIETVSEAEDVASALALGPEIQPDLAVLDYDAAPDKLASDLAELRTAWPEARYLVLLDDEQDRRRMQPAGADVALVKGIRAATILETIEGWLADQKPASPGGRS